MSASATQDGHKKKEERNYRMKILWSALLHRATINRPADNTRQERIQDFSTGEVRFAENMESAKR